MMYTRVNEYDFIHAFKDYGRDNKFSREGLFAIYDLLCESEEEMELDVVAICCEFTEYENLKEFQQDHGEEYKTIEDIEQETVVLSLVNSDSFVIANF